MNIKQYAKPNIQQENIDPWNSQQELLINGIQYTNYSPYQPINSQTISINPQNKSSKQINNKKLHIHSNNFADNLRKYQRKKAEDLQKKTEVNFIEKNRKDSFCNMDQKHQNMLISHIFHQQKTKKNHQNYFQTAIQPVNWSMIMYYEDDKIKQKAKHKDLQSFLKFHSVKLGKSIKNKTPEEHLQLNGQWLRCQNDAYQKLLKLKQGIRKRNLKSACSSRHQLQKAYKSIGFQDIKLNCTINVQNMSYQQSINQRREAKTSDSKRPRNTLECKIESKGLTKSIVLGQKQKEPSIRAIHSSQKNRGFRKILNIESNKLSSR